MLKCKITKLADTIWPLVYAAVPVMVYGPTGVGKSTVIGNELVPNVEKQFGPTDFHDIRLSTKDSVDGTRTPAIHHAGGPAYWPRPPLISGGDGAVSTPRSLELLNKTLRKLPLDVKNPTLENMSMAVCGDGFTRQFMTFITNLGANLPKIPEILANPTKAKVPTDPHFQYVVASAVAKNIDAKTASKFAEYLARLMPDIRSMAAHDAIARDSSLANNKDLKALVLEGSGK